LKSDNSLSLNDETVQILCLFWRNNLFIISGFFFHHFLSLKSCLVVGRPRQCRNTPSFVSIMIVCRFTSQFSNFQFWKKEEKILLLQYIKMDSQNNKENNFFCTSNNSKNIKKKIQMRFFLNINFKNLNHPTLALPKNKSRPPHF